MRLDKKRKVCIGYAVVVAIIALIVSFCIYSRQIIPPDKHILDAAAENDLDGVERCLDYGIGINERDDDSVVMGIFFDNITPLYVAAYHGHVEMVELLIARGADVNHQTYYKVAPLHKAACAGHRDVVKLLIEAGAEIDIQDHRKRTPLGWAIDGGTCFVEKGGSRKYGVGVNPPPDWMKRLEVAELLIDRGADVDGWTTEPKSALLCSAVTHGSYGYLKTQIAKGANIEARYYAGNTLLHLATKNKHRKIVEYLLENGALINPINDDYKTPLDLAVDKKMLDIAGTLRKHGGKTGQVLGKEK